MCCRPSWKPPLQRSRAYPPALGHLHLLWPNRRARHCRTELPGTVSLGPLFLELFDAKHCSSGTFFRHFHISLCRIFGRNVRMRFSGLSLSDKWKFRYCSISRRVVGDHRRLRPLSRRYRRIASPNRYRSENSDAWGEVKSRSAPLRCQVRLSVVFHGDQHRERARGVSGRDVHRNGLIAQCNFLSVGCDNVTLRPDFGTNVFIDEVPIERLIKRSSPRSDPAGTFAPPT